MFILDFIYSFTKTKVERITIKIQRAKKVFIKALDDLQEAENDISEEMEILIETENRIAETKKALATISTSNKKTISNLENIIK